MKTALTKRVNDKRVMRSLPLWKCLNKTTPYSWFEKHENFLSSLAKEVGFVVITSSEIESLDKGRFLHMTFTHEDGRSFKITLIRYTHFLGGGISFKEIDEPIYITSKYHVSIGDLGESRTDIGDWFLDVLRRNWST